MKKNENKSSNIRTELKIYYSIKKKQNDLANSFDRVGWGEIKLEDVEGILPIEANIYNNNKEVRKSELGNANNVIAAINGMNQAIWDEYSYGNQTKLANLYKQANLWRARAEDCQGNLTPKQLQDIKLKHQLKDFTEGWDFPSKLNLIVDSESEADGIPKSTKIKFFIEHSTFGPLIDKKSIEIINKAGGYENLPKVARDAWATDCLTYYDAIKFMRAYEKPHYKYKVPSIRKDLVLSNSSISEKTDVTQVSNPVSSRDVESKASQISSSEGSKQESATVRMHIKEEHKPDITHNSSGVDPINNKSGGVDPINNKSGPLLKENMGKFVKNLISTQTNQPKPEAGPTSSTPLLSDWANPLRKNKNVQSTGGKTR